MTLVKKPNPPCPCGRPYKGRGLCDAHLNASHRYPNGPWGAWRTLHEDVRTFVRWTYACDAPGCAVTGSSARLAAHGQGTHYCPDHYPLSRCRVCNRYVRPDKMLAVDWPDTVSRGTDGRCKPCQFSFIERIDPEPIPDYAKDAMRRLVAKYADPEYQEIILTALIGDTNHDQ